MRIINSFVFKLSQFGVDSNTTYVIVGLKTWNGQKKKKAKIDSKINAKQKTNCRK